MSEKLNKNNNFGRENKILTSEWEMVTKNNEGEPEVTTLHRYEYQGDLETAKELLIPPEKELKFRKRKLGQATLNACKTYFIFSDSHIGWRNVNGLFVPTHDPRSLELAKEIAYDIQPDYVMNLGDTLDLAEISRYDQDSNHFLGITQQAIDTAYDFEKGMRESTPNARFIELQGNHDIRFIKKIGKAATSLMGLKRAGTDGASLFSYEDVMNLKSLDIEYMSGYPNSTFMSESGEMQFRHGPDLRSNGSTAELLSKRYPYHGVIQGHGHKSQTHHRTRPDGKDMIYHMTPILGRTDGVIPGYNTSVNDRNEPTKIQEDWQSGISIYQEYPNGASEIRSIEFKDGVAFVDGKKYEARFDIKH